MKIVLVLDSIRSSHNVGAILRLADGLGVDKVYSTGITPHLLQADDDRLPHVIERAQNQISKTALGAEITVINKHYESTEQALQDIRVEGFKIIGLELTDTSIDLCRYKPASQRLAVVVGNEVDGLSESTLKLCDELVMIKMKGSKKSLNVSSAVSIATYYLQNLSTV